MLTKMQTLGYFPFYPILGLLGAYSTQALTVVPVCRSSIYCHGDLLHRVQMVRVFNDSKTFVDLRLLKSTEQTLDDYEALLQKTKRNPTKAELITFVDGHFSSDAELEPWQPGDFQRNPKVLDRIVDPFLRQFAKDVIQVWPSLGRRVSQGVHDNPTNYSLLYVPNGFIVPGGRFKEIYYWDTYWIVKGLLISGMVNTTRGVIENLLHLVNTIGYVPNGSRMYYLGRSQPPMLARMVANYVHVTKDIPWLAEHIDTLEKELQYWLDAKTVTLTRNGQKFTMLHYRSHGEGPRPESYREDYNMAQELAEGDRENFYMEMKSAAETGWDFSSRWFMHSASDVKGRLTDVHASRIVPVDLNAIFAGALEIAGNLRSLLKDRRAAKKWWSLAQYWRAGISAILYHDEDGVWYDYDINKGEPRRWFYPSCATPLWAGAVEQVDKERYGSRLAKYLLRVGALEYPGGIPASLVHSGEQWDFPNAWPPLQSILIGALEVSGDLEARKLALDQAQRWVISNYLGFKNGSKMYEKYDVLVPGRKGEGGEYIVQDGFGWTNGVVLELLSRYGHKLRSTVDVELTQIDNN